MLRTPAKTPSANESEVSPRTAGTVQEATDEVRPSVRRSIGEWETGKPETHTSPSPPNKTYTVGPPRPKPTAARGLSGASGSPPTKCRTKASELVLEARACLTKAKLNLSNSRNLKADIKLAVTEAVDRLYQLVKEADSAKTPPPSQAEAQIELRGKDEEMREGASASPPTNSSLEEVMKKHIELIKENTARVTTLSDILISRDVIGRHDDECSNNIGMLLGEVRELRQTTEETGRKVSSIQETAPSYAEVLARPNPAVTPTKLRPKHSIIVSSDDLNDTSELVLGKVREALEAKTTGIQVTRAQKVRNKKVVLSCGSKDELSKVKERIAQKTKGLNVEEAKNKDPLVIIKNLLTINTDADIISSLRSQNKGLLKDLGDDDLRAMVKYRRRARNPHENHVVLQVAPKLWKKLTEAGKVHVDLQYAVVLDQSPLVQCTRCLEYGHGRRQCTESVDLCSYCGGPHLRAECPVKLDGMAEKCRNCVLAKCAYASHSAFYSECPIRMRWDAIARASVAYC